MAISRTASASVLLAFALVALTCWAVLSAVCADSAEPPSFYGARLGLTASELRRKLAPPVPGTFRVAADALASGDLALEWAPVRTVASAPLGARFEIHAGLLVAIRATLPASSSLATGPPFAETSGSVLSRRENPDHTVTLTILARDCPTHAREVRALLDARTP